MYLEVLCKNLIERLENRRNFGETNDFSIESHVMVCGIPTVPFAA